MLFIVNLDDMPAVVRFYGEDEKDEAIRMMLELAEEELDDRDIRSDGEDCECFWVQIRRVVSGKISDCPVVERAFYSKDEDKVVLMK